MMQTEKTVQKIPEKLFHLLSGNWYGKPFTGRSGDFEEMLLVQPVKFESRLRSFALHKTEYITEFIVFNTPDPFGEEAYKKNPTVLRISGGEIVGMLGRNQRYYNRLTQIAQKKILYKAGMFHILGTVFQTLDLLSRPYQIENLEKYVPISGIQRFDPVSPMIQPEEYVEYSILG